MPKLKPKRTKRTPHVEAEYDVLSFGAHPDDVEVGTGGVLILLRDLGYRVGIVYLTEGEMGTGGTPAVRRREAESAARIMGVDIVKRFDWGDTKLFDSYEKRVEIASVIRRCRFHADP